MTGFSVYGIIKMQRKILQKGWKSYEKIFERSLSFLMSALLICSMAFSLQINTVVAEEADSTDEISFYENLSESDFTEDDTITVLIEFDYPENDYDIRETDSLESSQEQLRLLYRLINSERNKIS